MSGWIGIFCLTCLLISGSRRGAAQAPLPSREHLATLVRRLAKETAAFPPTVQRKLAGLAARDDRAKAAGLLATYTLLEVDINPEARVKLKPGSARPQIRGREAALFLVRVVNASGVTAPLRLTAQERPTSRKGNLTLSLEGLKGKGEPAALHGQPVEYVLLRATCTEPGTREVILTLDVGQGTQDLGFRSEVPLLFRCVEEPQKKTPSPPTRSGGRGARRRG